MGDLIYRNQYELIKVDYKPNRYYLLNTTEQHAVMNYGTERYIMSIDPPDRYIDPSWNAESPELYRVTEESKKMFFRVVDEFKNQQL
jgi:hypothetical protein